MNQNTRYQNPNGLQMPCYDFMSPQQNAQVYGRQSNPLALPVPVSDDMETHAGANGGGGAGGLFGGPRYEVQDPYFMGMGREGMSSNETSNRKISPFEDGIHAPPPAGGPNDFVSWKWRMGIGCSFFS